MGPENPTARWSLTLQPGSTKHNPALAPYLPSIFLHSLTMRKPQKRKCFKINSHSPREAESDKRSQQHPRSRNRLAEHGGNGSARHSQAEGKDEHGVQGNV